MAVEDGHSDSESDKCLTIGEAKTASQIFEVLLKYAGNRGRWQWLMFLMSSFCGMFTAFHNLSAAFLATSPDHWCRIPELEGANITTEQYKNISLPWELEDDGEWSHSQCSYFDRNYSEVLADGLSITNASTTPVIECQSWVYEDTVYKSTVVTEWNLVCGETWLRSTVQSSYMAGVLAGSLILGQMSDRFGRRTTVVFSALMFFVTSVAATFSVHYIMFVILRFFIAAFGAGLFLCNFVILMEVTGPETRTIIGMMYHCFFGFGFCLLPGIAYFLREWRQLQLAISVPSAILLLYYWLLPESPRWLMTQGRYDEAMETFRKIARANKRTFPSKEETDTLVSRLREKTEKIEKTSALENCIDFFKGQVILLSTPNLRRRSLIIFFSWFVVSMVYYGLTFSGGNIDASVYLTVFLAGFVEVPSYILVCVTLKKFGRRTNLVVLFLICGAACLFILAVPKERVMVNLALATVGKFFNSAAFAVAYIYSAELVPTAVRNVSVGTSSMCARLGSAIAPFIVDLLGDVHYTIPSSVFGALSLLAGFLALFLPETGNTRLPESVEEVEAAPR